MVEVSEFELSIKVSSFVTPLKIKFLSIFVYSSEKSRFSKLILLSLRKRIKNYLPIISSRIRYSRLLNERMALL